MQRHIRPAAGGATRQPDETWWTPPTPAAAALALAADRFAPSIQPIVALYLACRRGDEPYTDCFARLGAPGYAAMLHEALARLNRGERAR